MEAHSLSEELKHQQIISQPLIVLILEKN